MQSGNTRSLNVPPSQNGSVIGTNGRHVPMDGIELLQNPRVSRPPSEGANSRPQTAESDRPHSTGSGGRPPIVRESFFNQRNSNNGSDDGSDVASDLSGGRLPPFRQQMPPQQNRGGYGSGSGSGSDITDDDDDDGSDYSENLPSNNNNNGNAFFGQQHQRIPPRPPFMPGADTQQQQGAGGAGGGGFLSKLFGWKGGQQQGQQNQQDDAMSDSGSEMSMKIPSMENSLQRKQELLYKLDRLDKMGYHASRKYTMNNTLEEIKYEYDRLKKQRDADNAIKFSRKMLMAFVSGTEFLNDRFDPIGLQLSGWSEAIMEDLPSYDEVFEELHEKYKTKVQMAPELKLLWMVGSSAFMFHLTNSMFNPIKGRGGGGGIGNMMGGGMRDAAMNMMRDNMARTMAEEEMAEREAIRRGQQQQQQPQSGGGRREMRGPSGVDDLLNGLRNRQPNFQAMRSGTPPPSGGFADDDDEILSGDDEDVREIPGERIFNRPGSRVPLRR
jgi:hypothetical protein